MEHGLRQQRIPYETGVARNREDRAGADPGDLTRLFERLFHREDRRLLDLHAIGKGLRSGSTGEQAVYGRTAVPTTFSNGLPRPDAGRVLRVRGLRRVEQAHGLRPAPTSRRLLSPSASTSRPVPRAPGSRSPSRRADATPRPPPPAGLPPPCPRRPAGWAGGRRGAGSCRRAAGSRGSAEAPRRGASPRPLERPAVRRDRGRRWASGSLRGARSPSRGSGRSPARARSGSGVRAGRRRGLSPAPRPRAAAAPSRSRAGACRRCPAAFGSVWGRRKESTQPPPAKEWHGRARSRGLREGCAHAALARSVAKSKVPARLRSRSRRPRRYSGR